METSMITKKCECGTEFETENHEWDFVVETKCPECLRKDERAARIAREQEQAAKLEDLRGRYRARVRALTPLRMRQTSNEHPEFNRELWSKVSAWKPVDSRPWLGLVGPPGESKTRCAFLKLTGLCDLLVTDTGEEEPPSFAMTFGPDYSRLVLSQFGAGSDAEAGSRLGVLRRAEFLLFDELGKVRGTPAVIDELFSLIDFRHRENLLTIWTSNSPPERFCMAWPEDYAGPAAGRIIESSVILRA